MRFQAGQIEKTPTRGRRTDRLYRRVRLDGLGFDGVVRYDPVLEETGVDVREYIAEALNEMAARASYNLVCAQLWRPVEIPVDGIRGT
jgi:hypothetical protein